MCSFEIGEDYAATILLLFKLIESGLEEIKKYKVRNFHIFLPNSFLLLCSYFNFGSYVNERITFPQDSASSKP